MFGFIGISVSAVFNVLFLCFYLNVLPAFAQTTDFEKTVIFSQSKSPNKEPNRKVETVKNEQKVFVFINSHCSWCDQSLENLGRFKKRHPQWMIRVYVMGTAKEFLNFLRERMPSQDLEYALDFNNFLGDFYQVNQIPTYIIFKDNVIKKVEGYVDLFRLSLDRSA